MARAPYTRETLARIKSASDAGKGVNALASEIGWTPEELRRAGARHAIALIEDDLATILKADKPASGEPINMADDRFRIRRVKGTPRNHYKSVAFSGDAIEVVTRLANKHGNSPTSVIGVTFDYLCRKGRLPELFAEAMREST